MNYMGDFAVGQIVYIYFNTFDSNDPSASVTITNFINTDVHIHKDDSLTQRNNAAGITVDVDVDAITGTHFIKIDTADNTVADFFEAGHDYFVRIEGTTVDAATINAVVGCFSIANRRTAGQMAVTSIEGLTDQDTFTLTSGEASSDDDAYNDCLIVVTDRTNKLQKAIGYISDYTGATRTVQLYAAPLATGFTMAIGDSVEIFSTSAFVNVRTVNRTEQTAGDIPALVTTVDTVVDGIQTDLDNGTDGLGAIKTDTAAILTDTGTTLENHLTDIKGTGFVKDTHSLTDIEAFVDILDDGTSGNVKIATDVAAVLVDTNSLNDTKIPDTISLANINAECDTALTDYGALKPSVSGTSDSGTTSTMVDAARTESDTDYWKGSWIRFTSGTLNGQVRLITAFTPATDTITFAPVTTAAVGTHTYDIVPASNIDLVNTVTTNTDMRGTDSAALASVCTEARLAELDAGNIPADVDSILTDTGTTLENHLTDIKGTGFAKDTHSLTDIEAFVDILDDGTSGNVKIATDVAAVLVDTNSLNDTKIPDTISLANINAECDTALSDYGALQPSATGTADSGSTTTVVDAERTEADTDYWKGCWIRFTNGTLNGQTRLITGFTPATDTITFAPATTAAVTTHTYDIIAASNIDLVNTVTTNTDMRGTDSAALAAVCTEARLAELDAGNLPSDIDAILVDTGTTLENHLTDIKGTGFVKDTHSLIDIETYVDILDDGTSGNAKIATDVAAILVDTNSLNDTKIPDTISLANINAEVDTALDTSIPELGVGAPTATPTVRTGIMLLYMALRNKTVVQTSGTDALEIYNDAGTKIASKLLTDDGSDYTEAEMA